MMQTLYYTTHNFVRRSGNVIDLCEYRRRSRFPPLPQPGQSAHAAAIPTRTPLPC